MTIPKCELTTSSSVLRSNDWTYAFRLTEPSPHYDRTPEAIHAIIKWLGVERGKRWKPRPGATYCNVYATDFANACGVYLPRVWWMPAAERDLLAGKSVTAAYGTTAMEMSANSLFRWLSGPHSGQFGWLRLDDLSGAQNLANGGHPVVICCRKKVEASPGHIAVVAPETDSVRAVRDGEGNVLLPVLSQAGARNEELGVASSWWDSPDMAEWGAWANHSS